MKINVFYFEGDRETAGNGLKSSNPDILGVSQEKINQISTSVFNLLDKIDDPNIQIGLNRDFDLMTMSIISDPKNASLILEKISNSNTTNERKVAAMDELMIRIPYNPALQARYRALRGAHEWNISTTRQQTSTALLGLKGELQAA